MAAASARAVIDQLDDWYTSPACVDTFGTLRQATRAGGISPRTVRILHNTQVNNPERILRFRKYTCPDRET